jgi:penicillin-binding protein 2
MARMLGQSADPIPPGRLRAAGLLVVLVFALFVGRLFQLQIIQGELLAERSERNSIRIVHLDAPRGDIVDREGRVVATTRPAFELQVIPSELRGAERTWLALGQLLGDDPAALAERVGNPRGSARFRPVRLDGDMSFDRLARVEAHRHALAGVVTDVRPRRHYPGADHAAHLLGTIGEISADQLESEPFEGYRSGDVVGKTGVEARFESHLHGRPGGRNVVVDVAGREVDVLDEVRPLPGGRVVLALDIDLQRAGEAAFLEVPEGEPPKMGAAVAMDVRTGDLLALVSRPAYDPNALAGGIDSATWKALTTDEWDPLQNRALQNHYPPASTYKAVMALAMLEAGVVTPHSKTFCPGYFHFGRRNYRCWKRGGHGSVDLHKALQQSCDVFFYHFGVELGIDRIAGFATRLLLGRSTGISLGQEAFGLVPSRAWKEKRFGEPWYPGETVSVSIGQGYNLMTPIQMAVTYAAIANGGRVLRPRPVIRLETREGEVVETFPPQIRDRIELDPAHWAAVRRGLDAVVNEPGGTGSRARVEGLRVAGKTGTSQVVRLDRTEGLDEGEIPMRYRDHAWFAAFAPSDEPEIAVAVFVEHGQHGSSAAAPVAQRILAAWHAKRAGSESEPELESASEAESEPNSGDALRVVAENGVAVD